MFLISILPPALFELDGWNLVRDWADELFCEVIEFIGRISLLVEFHGDLFSRHACPLEGAVLFCGGRRTIVNVANDPKRRASPVAFEPRRCVHVTLYQLLHRSTVGQIYKHHAHQHKRI